MPAKTSPVIRNTGGTIERRLMAHEKNVVQIPNAFMRDTSLTLKARGLLALLMTHRDGFTVSLRALADEGHGGLGQLRSAAAELEKAGYLVRVNGRTGAGTYGTRWLLQDPPDRVQKLHAVPDPDADRVQLSDADNCTDKEHHSKNTTTTATQANHRAAPTPCRMRRYLPCQPTAAGTCATCGDPIQQSA